MKKALRIVIATSFIIALTLLTGCAGPDMAVYEEFQNKLYHYNKVCQLVYEDHRAEVASLWMMRKPDLTETGSYKSPWLLCAPTLEAYNYYKSLGIDPAKQFYYMNTDVNSAFYFTNATPAALLGQWQDGFISQRDFSTPLISADLLTPDSLNKHQYLQKIGYGHFIDRFDFSLETGWRPDPDAYNKMAKLYSDNSYILNMINDTRTIANARINRADELAKRFTACKSGEEASCEQLDKTLATYSPMRQQLPAAMALAKNRRSEFAAARTKDSCRPAENNWRFIGSSCQSGVAHGKGEAFHFDGKLTFKGLFDRGQRVNGLISISGSPMYDGPLVDGKPDGNGVCYFKGEPEECRYYQGKRIDSLHKQRLEFAEQQELLKKQQAEMTAMRQELADLKNRPVQGAENSNSRTLGDVVTDKATDYVIRKLFDRLF